MSRLVRTGPGRVLIDMRAPEGTTARRAGSAPPLALATCDWLAAHPQAAESLGAHPQAAESQAAQPQAAQPQAAQPQAAQPQTAQPQTAQKRATAFVRTLRFTAANDGAAIAATMPADYAGGDPALSTKALGDSRRCSPATA